MSNITMFSIQNNTASPVGPYGLSGLTIAASSSVNVQPPLNGLLSDSAFFSDFLAGNVSVSVAGQPLSVSSLFQDYLKIASTADLSNSYQNITGNATTVVKTGTGILHAIIVGNNNSGGVVSIYDNTAGSGTLIMTLQLGTPSGGLLSSTGLSGPEYLNVLNLKFSTGLTIVTSGSSNNNITIIYQ